MRTSIRLIFVALLGLFVTSAHAGTVTLRPPPTIKANSPPGVFTPIGGNGSQTLGIYTTGGNATFSGGTLSGSFTTEVMGRAISHPATLALASNAASVAVSAIRSTPAMLIGGAVASWLLSEGIEYVNNEFMKQGGLSWVYQDHYGQRHATVAEAKAASESKWRQQRPDYSYCYFTWGGPYTSGNTYWATLGGGCSGGVSVNKVCPSGSTCSDEATAATEIDWDKLRNKAFPDGVASELSGKTPLPLQPPQFQPRYQDAPITDPYIDPADGKRKSDRARVTPRTNEPVADVAPYKTEVDAAGNPIMDANGNPTTVETPDPCKTNPDAAGCKPLDEVPDEPLQTKTINLSVVPLPGFGPGNASCPAPQNLMAVGGQQITWSWSKFCDFSLGIRPLILGFAWIAAIMIVVGVARREV